MSENDKELVLREPAGGKEIHLPQDEIGARKKSETSAMPAGLVNQLQDRSQFLDLVRFLLEINDNPDRLKEIKQAVSE
ncbi:MAG: hypothetical protein HON04_10790 [Planctomicrobium sp.]|nr:hypothetical protein [Planctomicrobium sp.]